MLLSYRNKDQKWHRVDIFPDDTSSVNIVPDYEGTLDNNSVHFKYVASRNKYNGRDIHTKEKNSINHCQVDNSIHFPSIPLPLPDSRLPKLFSNASGLKMWHLQDRKFKLPVAYLRMNILCAHTNK